MKIRFELTIVLLLACLAYGCNSKDPVQDSRNSPAEQADATPVKPAEEKSGSVVVTPVAQHTATEDVVIPDGIKTKWKTVGITVLNKQDNTSATIDVAIGSEAKLTDAPLKITVKHFIPDFTMEGTEITSATDRPNNPAAYLIVSKDGVDVYRGWLFTRYPNMNKFEDPKYGLTLSTYK